MAQKILIAMDESENAFRAVDFVGNSLNPDADVTLFSVLMNTATLCAMQSPELTPYFMAEQSAFCTLEDKKKDLVNQALEKARQKLVKTGFDERRIHVKTAERNKGIARDIIAEANNGGFDLVVLGKRGISGIKEFIMGSISQKVLNGVKNASVLLVD
jgi:nucleotide-binding universal stress UspA family protein